MTFCILHGSKRKNQVYSENIKKLQQFIFQGEAVQVLKLYMGNVYQFDSEK